MNFLYSGRMMDVPVDEWANVVLELTAACAARHAAKQAAVQRLVAARGYSPSGRLA